MIEHQSRLYPWALLAALWVTYLLSSLDRMVINLLVEPIKADFGLSDTQISLLLGPAFIVMFSVAIIPMGILVDRMNRTRLLAIGLGFWSLMTGLCGLASSFAALFVVRAGVGLGEATLNPAGYSLISDAFKKERLGVALGIFITGGAVGAGLAFILGGVVIGGLSRHGDFHIPVIGALRPWQSTFLILSAPGMVMAIILTAMPNPARSTAPAESRSNATAKGFYRENKAMLSRHHIAMGVTNMVQLGTLAWIAPLLTRIHGWDAGSIGMTVGTILLVAIPAGLLVGGLIGDYLMRFGTHMRLVACAIAFACGAICGVLYPLQSNPWTAILLFGATSIFAAIPPGVGNAALQHVVPAAIRGRVSAIYYLVVLVLGMAGPMLIGLASDHLFPFRDGIRYATVVIIPTAMLVACIFFLWAIRPYRLFVEEAQRDQAT